MKRYREKKDASNKSKETSGLTTRAFEKKEIERKQYMGDYRTKLTAQKRDESGKRMLQEKEKIGKHKN